MTDHSNMKLGRRAVRHDGRTLRLARYLGPEILAAPPQRVDWSAAMTNMGVMTNDVLGSCTAASAGHMIQAWSAQNGNQVIIPDADVVAFYSASTGYVPGDPSTDQGGIELDVLNAWRKVGIGGHKILGYVAVDPRNRTHMQLAIDLFGGVYAGAGLPITAQTQEVWTVPPIGPVGNGSPNSLGGHAFPLLNYGPLGCVCVTWGLLKTLTWSWIETYVDEAYAILSDQWAPGGRKAPSGFDLTALQADLAAVAG